LRSEKPIGEERRYGHGEMAMKCSNCGAENPEGKRFCGDCGGKLLNLPEQERGEVACTRPVLRRNWVKSNWRFLAIVVIVISQVMVMLAVVITAPISEIHISLRNVEETDTAYLTIYLDDKFAEHLYIGPHGLAGGLFHVSPGKHSIGIDLTYDDQLDGIEDFLWTGEVDFNGVDFIGVVVSRAGIYYDIVEIFRFIDLPVEQALRDPNVVVPTATMVFLQVLLVMVVWNPLRESSGGRTRPHRRR